jgi:5'-nucleotidase
VLITNDDGVDSVGIQILAAAIASTGEHEVIVVAPADDRSGTGAALGSFSPSAGGLQASAVTLPEAPDVEAWALEGTPAMCVLAAALGGFGERPELVVSGINAGLNTGRAVLHSGTVGAALTGQNFGLSGLAVSTALNDPWHWDTAAAYAVEVLPLLIDAPARSVLNLNVPALPYSEVRGIRWARLAPFGETRAAFVADPVDAADGDEDGNDDPRRDPAPGISAGAPEGFPGAIGAGHHAAASAVGERRRLRMELQLAEHDFDDDTDTGVCRDGWAALTAIVGVTEAWPGDHDLDPDGPAAITRAIVPGAPLDPAHRLPDHDAVGVLRRPVIVP